MMTKSSFHAYMEEAGTTSLAKLDLEVLGALTISLEQGSHLGPPRENRGS